MVATTSDFAAIRPRVVGVIPAAGMAARLGRLPCSKELLPLDCGDADRAPEVAIVRLVGRMRAAGVGRVVVAIREGKWDLPAYLGDGRELGVTLAFVVLRSSGSIVETLQATVPWLGDDLVVLGFPDIVFEPEDLLDRTVESLVGREGDVVLAAVPTDRPGKADLLELDAAGGVLDVAIKPPPPWPEPAWTWVGAAWGPRMTRLLAEDDRATSTGRERYPGDLLHEAIAQGLAVHAVCAHDGRHLDIGTPDDLARAWREALV